MGRRISRYKKMEKMITVALCKDAIVFIAYLIFAGIGQIAECVAIGAMEFDKIVAFAKEKEID